MIKVFKVDGNTRLYMPTTSWTTMVLASLLSKGHDVVEVEEAPGTYIDDRSPEELARRDALLESTGL